MKPGLLAMVALAMMLAPAASAPAQTSSGVLYALGAGHVLAESDVPIHVAGALTVSFHGDAATGCAAYGLCAYSGTIVVRPGMGDLGVLTERLDGRIRHLAELFLAPPVTGYMTVANVQRAIAGQPSGTCGDGESSVGITLGGAAIPLGRTLRISVLAPGGSLLSTRCAGPLDSDLAGAGPEATISAQVARHGRATVELTGTHAFAAHGFAGTVNSTLVLTLGKPTRESSNSSFPPGIKTQRVRTVIEHLSLVRVAGTLGATVQGSANPVVCRLLDSCGLTGTLSLEQAPRDAAAEVIATGPATRPYGDFLTALGRGRGGDAHGISVSVSVGWSGDSVSAEVAQAGVCSDSAPLSNVFASLTPRPGGLRGSGGTGAWRTRCPGPVIGDQQAALFSATAPALALGRRAFTIELRPLGSISEDGYTVALHGRLSVVVRRGRRITQSVSVQPSG